LEAAYLTRLQTISKTVDLLREKGAFIPSSVIRDLRLARSLAAVLKKDPECIEAEIRLEECLDNIEAELFSVAEKIGIDDLNVLVKEPEKRLSLQVPERLEIWQPPAGERWVRVTVSEDLPTELIVDCALKTSVKYRLEKGHVLAYGDDDHLKTFIKLISEKLKTRHG